MCTYGIDSVNNKDRSKSKISGKVGQQKNCVFEILQGSRSGWDMNNERCDVDDDDLRWIDIFSVYLSWLGVWQHLKYWVYISKRIHGKAI